jgi:hypothetical protein
VGTPSSGELDDLSGEHKTGVTGLWTGFEGKYGKNKGNYRPKMP